MSSTEPVAVCWCGVLLLYIQGGWQHADVCIDCHDTGLSCLRVSKHGQCPSVGPRVCLHASCQEPAEPDIDCASGMPRYSCCGCCWVRADALEARRMWPR